MEMKYHILDVNGNRIASFVYATDRDACIDTFRKLLPDCTFSTLDDE